MGAMQQVFPLSSTQGVLPIVTSIWAGYSVLKLTTNATKCLRVRRSSDNVEQDIGFAGQTIDSSGLLSFVGANDGFVVTWYDQVASNDLTQATAANQPQIVYAGVYYGCVNFNGSSHKLQTITNSNAVPALTTYFAGRQRRIPQGTATGAPKNYIYAHVTNDATFYNQYGTGGGTVNNIQSNVLTGPSGGASYFAEPLTSELTTYVAVHNLSVVGISNQATEYVNAAQQTSVATGGSAGSGNFTANTWALGSDSVLAASGRISVQSFLFYEAAHTSGTIGTIGASITPSVYSNGLNNFTTSLSGLYALRKLRSAYAGSCLRVRRSSDNTEQDVGFAASGIIDSASMLTFVGANNGFVTKWYDQSAAANDLIQATLGTQPQIVSAGSYLGSIQFDGVDDILTQTNNSGATSSFTAYTRCFNRVDSGAIATADFCNHGNTASPDCTMTMQAAFSGWVFATLDAAGNAVPEYKCNVGGQVVACKFTKGAGSFAAACQAYNGGQLMTPDATNNSGSPPAAGNFTTTKWNIGARVGSVDPAKVNYYALALYETGHSDTTVDQISLILG